MDLIKEFKVFMMSLAKNYRDSTILFTFLFESDKQLKKITAIIILALFFAMQYGKLIGYWNCKISSSNDVRAVQCDCDKILTDTNAHDDSTLLAKIQPKEKIEELFCPYPSLLLFREERNSMDSFLLYNPGSPHMGVTCSIFQPPRFA